MIVWGVLWARCLEIFGRGANKPTRTALRRVGAMTIIAIFSSFVLLRVSRDLLLPTDIPSIWLVGLVTVMVQSLILVFLFLTRSTIGEEVGNPSVWHSWPLPGWLLWLVRLLPFLLLIILIWVVIIPTAIMVRLR